MTTIEQLSNTAVEAAVMAAALIKSHFGDEHNIKHKGVVDLVTEVDIASEHFIKGFLEKKHPEIAFFGEEGGCVKNWKSGEVWVVDPIDGTCNFASRLEHFCVSIALCRDGVPVAGAIAQPLSGDVYYAYKGGGAYLNGHKICVSQTSCTDDALSVTGFPYNRREHIDIIMKRFRAMLLKTQDVRRLGSAALDLCYVARGVFGIFWEQNLKPWDIAAGTLLVNEAGGRVSKYDGSEMHLDSLELLATNGALHEEAVKILQSA